jgi:hypothetical protein
MKKNELPIWFCYHNLTGSCYAQVQARAVKTYSLRKTPDHGLSSNGTISA